mgnify:CR=1 FL=1
MRRISNSTASVFLLVLHRYRLHSPFLPSIIQTKTKQFLQLEITLVIFCQYHTVIITRMNKQLSRQITVQHKIKCISQLAITVS